MPARRETVADMLARGAVIRWVCDAGYPHQHYGDADLQAMVAAGRGGAVLAVRRPRCKAPGCPGRVRFFDKSGAWPKLLDAIPTTDPASQAYIDQRHADFRAAGWVWQMGSYVKPK